MKLAIICLCMLFYPPAFSQGNVGPIGKFIQANLVGYPVIHEQQTWIFDPDIALRRRKQFIADYGDKGVKLVEKLGLGIDGYEQERLQLQQQRDRVNWAS